MIPLKIQLKNFLSYGPHVQEIDFGPYGLICLSGRNGHGKSALLDAMCWALWGQGRKVSSASKADGNLLHLGQTHMMVRFDFLFNEQHYRIKREFAHTYGKPYASLEVGIVDHATGNVRPLTDKTIRATQAVIEEQLGLSYEAFTNTAFLRQGHANEFSQKSPKERKEILANILSLKEFDAIRKGAMERIREASTTMTIMQQLTERIGQELKQKKSLTQEHQTVLTTLTNVTEHEQKIAAQLSELQGKQQLLSEQLQQQKLLMFTHQECIVQQQETQQQLRGCYATWKELHRQRSKLVDRQQLEQRKQQLTTAMEQHNQRLQGFMDAKQALIDLTEQEQKVVYRLQQDYRARLYAHQQELQRIEIASSTAQSHLTQLRDHEHKSKQGIQQCQEAQQAAEKEIAVMQVKVQSLECITQQFEKRKTHYHKWRTEAQQYTQELQELHAKQNLSSDGDTPSCPLCEQNLSASRRRFLLQKFKQQEERCKRRIARFNTVLETLKKLLVSQHTLVEQGKKETVSLQQLHMQSAVLGQQLQEHTKVLTRTKKELEQVQQNVNKQQALLTSKQQHIKQLEEQEHSFITQHADYQALATQRASITAAMQSVGYDKQAHEKTTHALATVKQDLQNYEQLADQLTMQTQRMQEMLNILTQLRAIKKKKQELDRKIQVGAPLEQHYNALKQEGERIAQEQKKLLASKEAALQEQGRLDQALATLKRTEQELQEQSAQRALLQETVVDYQAIATAMGKDGVQALLIENAVPEIEHETNVLLSQLTDNQTHVTIESLRDLKKGGTKETLDIMISDPAGIRPYEMFSGGEAFRIDFALRIAISKLLARRAGTSLQTLIIDEGFGSQDEEGLGKIMDAIYRIQDNFKKIIIVSHLGWLKDQFPVHFHVHKGPHGSTVTRIEQA